MQFLAYKWQLHGHEILGRFDLGSVGSGFEGEAGTLFVVALPEDCGGGGLILDPPLQSLLPLLLAMLAARVLETLRKVVYVEFHMDIHESGLLTPEVTFKIILRTWTYSTLS